jgi:hypothetical protein
LLRRFVRAKGSIQSGRLPSSPAAETLAPSFRGSPGQRGGHRPSRGSRPRDDASLRPGKSHDYRCTDGIPKGPHYTRLSEPAWMAAARGNAHNRRDRRPGSKSISHRQNDGASLVADIVADNTKQLATRDEPSVRPARQQKVISVTINP